MKPNVLFTGIIKNEFGLHFNQNKLNTSYKDTAAYFWLVSNLVFPYTPLWKHSLGFHSKSGGLSNQLHYFEKGKEKKKKICVTQMKSQQEFSLLTSPATVTSHYGYMGSPGSSARKKSSCNAGNLGSIPQLGRSPGGGNGNPLQHSCLENPRDRGACWATVHVVPKSQTRLSN